MMIIEVGETLFSSWLNDHFLYPAVVVAKDEDISVHVAYLDGDEAEVAIEQLRRLDLSIGSRVSVNWKGRNQYYWGQIKKQVGLAYKIAYEDGTIEWTTLAQCRVPIADLSK